MRLGQWIVNILEDKYGSQNITLGDRMLRHVDLSQVLFNISNDEYLDIVLAYYKNNAWDDRENNLNYKSVKEDKKTLEHRI